MADYFIDACVILNSPSPHQPIVDGFTILCVCQLPVIKLEQKLKLTCRVGNKLSSYLSHVLIAFLCSIRTLALSCEWQ